MNYWQKQTMNTPLFKDIMWSRPETRQGAGKLLIVGGNSHSFSSVGQAYQNSKEAGIGVAHVLLPVSLKKTIGNIMENASYAPSTPSGSFGLEAMSEMISHSSWSDGVLLSGDFGRNSETAILLEKFVDKYTGKLIATNDSVDCFYNQPDMLLNREGTVIAIDSSQLQKLGTHSKFQTPFLLGMGLMLTVQALHSFTLKHNALIIVKDLNNIIVAHKGRVSTTKLARDQDAWQIEIASKASVFWIQNPNKPFESITTAMIA